MSKRDEFIAIVKRVKSVLSTITDEQQEKLISQGRTYGLTLDAAKTILQDEGLTNDQDVNFFEVLDLDIKDIESLSESEIKTVIDTNHKTLTTPYNKDHSKNNPYIKAKIELFDEARKVLLHQTTRQQHIASIKNKPRPKHGDLLFTFATTGIPQLASLIEKNRSAATDILYSGGLAKCLSGTPLANAAKAVVDKFRSDKSMGMKAMVAIISGKIEFTSGGAVSKPQELATRVDKNWDEAKKLLYNGFFAIWLKYTNKTKLATKTNEIVLKFSDADMGLEAFIQELDPDIGTPKAEVSLSEIDFGTMNINSKKTKEFEIKNKSRGMLSGDVIDTNIPGLRIKESTNKGRWIVSVEIDTSSLATQTYNGALLVRTNGGNIGIPITFSVESIVQKSVKRITIHGLSVGAIAVVARLIVEQVATSGWLATHLTGEGFIGWGHYWQWVEWFKWPWFEWRVFTLSGPGTDLGYVIAFTLLGVGIFCYWYFFFKKKIMS